MAQTQQPAYRAFTIVKRDGQDDFWLPIGAAFAHQSGDGFNVILQALPLNGNGKLVVLAYDPEAREEKAADGERTTAAAFWMRCTRPGSFR